MKILSFELYLHIIFDITHYYQLMLGILIAIARVNTLKIQTLNLYLLQTKFILPYAEISFSE